MSTLPATGRRASMMSTTPTPSTSPSEPAAPSVLTAIKPIQRHTNKATFHSLIHGSEISAAIELGKTCTVGFYVVTRLTRYGEVHAIYYVDAVYTKPSIKGWAMSVGEDGIDPSERKNFFDKFTKNKPVGVVDEFEQNQTEEFGALFKQAEQNNELVANSDLLGPSSFLGIVKLGSRVWEAWIEH
jgi:hypothetical protein